MGLKRGMTNNPHGRPAGSVNKTTKGMRERINAFLEENFDLIQKDFKKLSPKDRLLFYTKLLAFGLPTLKSVEHSDNTSKKLEELTTEQLNEVISELLIKYDEQ